jgi:hypothetical protein
MRGTVHIAVVQLLNPINSSSVRSEITENSFAGTDLERIRTTCYWKLWVHEDHTPNGMLNLIVTVVVVFITAILS